MQSDALMPHFAEKYLVILFFCGFGGNRLETVAVAVVVVVVAVVVDVVGRCLTTPKFLMSLVPALSRVLCKSTAFLMTCSL